MLTTTPIWASCLSFTFYSMERVQFQQEQMLHELKDLVEKSIFTEVRVVNLRGVFCRNDGEYSQKSKKL